MVTPRRALTPPQAAAATLPAAPAQERKHLRHFILFLVGADMVVLFIYLLLVPTDVWEGVETRLQSMATLVKSVGTGGGSVVGYFGLKRTLRQYLLNVDTVFDQPSFAALVCLVTVILWAGVLPVWQVQLQFYPPQPMPPRVKILDKARALVEIRGMPTAERAYVLEGLLLRPYELEVEGARETLDLPLITVLKGSLFRRSVFVQLPCTLEITPLVPKAEVYLRRVGEKQEQRWGLFPDDGKLLVMPGSYEYIRITDGRQDVRTSLTMGCPKTSLEINWK